MWEHTVYRAVAEFFQKQIARSRVGTHLVIKLKHQCDAILAAGLGISINFGNQRRTLAHRAHCSTIKDLHRFGANIGN